MDMNIEMDKNTATDSITSRLADARNDLGITQKDLASATGISVMDRLQLTGQIF